MNRSKMEEPDLQPVVERIGCHPAEEEAYHSHHEERSSGENHNTDTNMNMNTNQLPPVTTQDHDNSNHRHHHPQQHPHDSHCDDNDNDNTDDNDDNNNIDTSTTGNPLPPSSSLPLSSSLPPPSSSSTSSRTVWEDHPTEETERDNTEEPANKRPRVSESPPILETTAPTATTGNSSSSSSSSPHNHNHIDNDTAPTEIVVEEQESETAMVITQSQPPEPQQQQQQPPPDRAFHPNVAMFEPPPPPPPHSSQPRSISSVEFLKQINDLRAQFQPRRQPQQQQKQQHRSVNPFEALRPLQNPRLPSASQSILRHQYHHQQQQQQRHHHNNTVPNQADYLPVIPNFRSTWNQLAPDESTMRRALQNQQHHHHHSTAVPSLKKTYQLSLLNVNEFTIEGVSPSWNRSIAPTSIQGLRQPIRQICRKHGVKAVYDTLKSNVTTMDGGEDEITATHLPSNGAELVGKWRIPLSVYHQLAGYLSTLENTEIVRIPEDQLRIASLERARQEKGYPDADVLVQYGIPRGLAKALAPFQRGGVDFVRDKKGRAWIADDMGLGKSIQAVASMAMYHAEWPLLVLCPSGARYHWENEFKQWLGVDSYVNRTIMNIDEDTIDNDGDKVFPDSIRKRPHGAASTGQRTSGPLLHDWQINVLGSSKSEIFPFPDTKVVICSYGLSSVLIDTQKILPNMFRCAIVDESHMLKNKAAKRTSLLLPVLERTIRCVLLSGTPALARPVELWPQLAMLGPDRHGWNVGTEQQFMDKYVKNGNPQRSAELHTMLRGTVMIRRLKNDVLKTLPQKVREKAEVHVIANKKQRAEFKYLLDKLREGNGVMGKLARLHHTENESSSVEPTEDQHFTAELIDNTAKNTTQEQMKLEQDHLYQNLNNELLVGQNRIRESLLRDEENMGLNDEQRIAEAMRREEDLRTYISKQSLDGQQRIKEKYSTPLKDIPYAGDTDESRSAILSRLYNLTGDAKVPLIVDTLKRWLADPTKGKVCVFAHHLSVLDAIRDEVGLSNIGSGSKKYIRIDGQTLPKARQEQITAFQTDLSIRVALLGITAAGVAVTLTASSTVWFAELFWTPAIMIQAEDRCHRIGQNAAVKCLYFVAKGTMDDILWKLLEKKFCDLGEFVEGQEKLKIAVNKTYDGHRALQSALFDVDASDESDSQTDDDDIDFGGDFQLDGEFEHDIEALGEEEMRMLQSLDPEADEAAYPDPGDAKVPAKSTSDLVENGIGKSEDDAISLSDDDDDDQLVAPVQAIDELPNDDVLDGCRLYRTRINESTLGVQLVILEGRIVVSGVGSHRTSRYGPNAKPQVGDIFCCVQGLPIPLFTSINEGVDYLKRALTKVPIELTFVEAPKIIAKYRTLSNGTTPNALVSVTRSAVPDVIELLDD